jgi:hypothetical protein
MTAYDAHLRSVAAYGLLGSVIDMPRQPVDPPQWRQLLGSVRRQRLTGLLNASVLEDAFPTTSEQREEAVTAHLRALAGVLALERLLLGVLDALERRGIAVRVLKGTAIGHLDYPDPALRTFGDVDLLVRPESFDAAVAALSDAGHRRRYPQPRPGFDSRFSKGTSFVTVDGFEIDLHRTFTMGPFGLRLALDRLWERSTEFDLGGRAVSALGAEERFLHACYHATLGEVRPRLMPLRDTAQLLLERDLDLDRVRMLMAESSGEPVVSRAVHTAWRTFELADVVSLSAWAEDYRADDRAQADLAVYTGQSSYAAKSAAAVRAIPSIPDKVRFVAALVAPERGYLGQRHHGNVRRLLRGARQVIVQRERP